MNYIDISGQNLKATFLELHKHIVDEFGNDQELIDAVFEKWVDELLDEGYLQFASVNN